MQQNIEAESVKNLSVSNYKKDIDAALHTVEKNYDKWTSDLNSKIDSIATKYEAKMPDLRLEYEQKLRHAKLVNGSLIDIISGGLTY